jgi:hypothetical protein
MIHEPDAPANDALDVQSLPRARRAKMLRRWPGLWSSFPATGNQTIRNEVFSLLFSALSAPLREINF